MRKEASARAVVVSARKYLSRCERDYHNSPCVETRSALDDAREELATARERLVYLEAVAEQ